MLGTSIHKILRGFNDGFDKRYWGEKKLKRISVPVTDVPICHNSHEMMNPRTKEKRGKRNTITCMGAYILLNTHPNHTSRAIWARGAKCRGPFFRSTADRVQHLSNLPGIQGPSSPVVHGSQDMKRNGPKAIHQVQAPKKLTKAQPI